MLKKLRCKFICVIMAVVTVMLCLLLGLVIFFMSKGMEYQSIRLMQTIAQQAPPTARPRGAPQDVRLPVFTVQTDPKGTILKVEGSISDLADDQSVQLVTQAALTQTSQTGKLEEDEWTKLAMASAALSQTDIRIDDNPSITVAEMNAMLRRVEDLGLVIIDYLQLMTGSGYGKQSDNRVQIVGDISRSLKIMAKELNVPVICLSQLSRAVESRQDKRPMMSDLRESGAIEQDADVIMFIYRDDYYNENSEEKNVAECIVSKNRHGETGTVKLQWLPQFTTFADREWKHAD